MQYRRLGRTGIEVSHLGFGAMRLPSGCDGKPDPQESIHIIHRAFELGVNFIDTAVMYCDYRSQGIVGQAVKSWPGRIYVSTKNHYYGPDEGEWWANVEKSLELLQVDAIDIYNIHGLNWEQWKQRISGEGGILSWMRKAHAQGLIQNVCCSFHDSPEALRKIADTEAFSSIILQYNLLDRSLEPVLEELAQRDIGVIVMGPVGGGRLGPDSDAVRAMVPGARSTAEVALRFVLANPHVTSAISGMSTLEQVEENCAIANRDAEPLSADERAQVDETLARLKGLADLYCTGCNYCMPCPSGVDIPGNFLAENRFRVYRLKEGAQKSYDWLVGKASYCLACGACEPKCPQNIPIRAQLIETAGRFDRDYGKVRLTLEPVRRDNGGIECRTRFHNISDLPADAQVSLRAEEAVVSPRSFDIHIDEPFMQERRELVLENAPEAPSVVRVTASIRDRMGTREEQIPLAFGPCHAAASMADLRRRCGALEPIAIEHEAQVMAGKEWLHRPYSARAWAGYTPEHFLLYAEVNDRPAPQGFEDEPPKLYIDLVLDLRNREDDLAPGYRDSMCLVRLPVTPGSEIGAYVIAGDVEKDAFGVTCRDAGEWSELSVEAAWALLTQPEGDATCRLDRGEGFGFDLALGSMPTTDGRQFRAVWAGPSTLEREPKPGVLFFD